jgi:hypothetical protein
MDGYFMNESHLYIREVAARWPEINYEETILDNVILQVYLHAILTLTDHFYEYSLSKIQHN